MVKRNENFSKLKPSYFFSEIQKKVSLFKEKEPQAKLISLSIGDTTHPLAPTISKGLEKKAQELSTWEGYRGYGLEQGEFPLRELISKRFYDKRIQPHEIFISDGAKCDLGRLQMLFGTNRKVALQDPTYPVYLDSSFLMGQEEVIFLPCLPENDFFPDLTKCPPVDLIFFCSPNNPTGKAATREELTQLVAFAKKHQAIIIFDVAYSYFIQDPNLPKSIYEIEGADEVAIEVSSFSKRIGFSGVRLGWTCVPEALKYAGGQSVRADWLRLMTTIFNGASNLSQAGGMSALSDQGIEETAHQIAYYRENAKLLRQALQKSGLKVFGGENCPYLWTYFGQKEGWELFNEMLEQKHLITAPGIGYGPSGNGFLRLSPFGPREDILEACRRLES